MPFKSKMIRHSGNRPVGKSFISGSNQAREIGISSHAKECPRSRPDLVPFHAVEPAILVRATANRQDHGGWRQAILISICRELEACDQFHVDLNLRLIASRTTTERSSNISEDRAPAAGAAMRSW